MNSLTVKRVLMTFAGIFLAGVSVAIFKASDFGTDPNSCFVMGVWNLAGIKYSYVYIAINALMLLGVFFLDRHFIGLGTVLNLFFMGIIVEKGMQLFDRYLPERTFGVRVLLMCIAVVMMCFASALYFTADMGVSAYDAYALILDKRTRIPFRMCRIGTDVITTAAGFFMGAAQNIRFSYVSVLCVPDIPYPFPGQKAWPHCTPGRPFLFLSAAPLLHHRRCMPFRDLFCKYCPL